MPVILTLCYGFHRGDLLRPPAATDLFVDSTDNRRDINFRYFDSFSVADCVSR